MPKKKKNKSMFFRFKNNYTVVANYPKEVVYEKIISYIRKNDHEVISVQKPDKISFQTCPTLISFPINLDLILNVIDEKSTILSVNYSSRQLDLGRSRKIIDNILAEKIV